MALLFADVFISVDGSALGTRSPGYFGFYGPDLGRWIEGEQAIPRLSLMGRKTYEVLAGLPPRFRDESWKRTTRQPTLLFSRTLDHADWPGVTVSPADAVTEVSRLRRTDGPDLRTIGSLSLVQQFLAAGVVDRLRLMVFPLVLGESGARPVFETVGDLALHLHGETVLDGRIVLLDYRPAGAPPYAGASPDA